MAAPQWTGGKCHTVQDAKAFFRHNDKDRRLEMNHANPHIDKTKTGDNFTYRGLSYSELCRAFDARMASVDLGQQRPGRTVLQSVILYPPAQLPEARLRDWFMDAGRVMESLYGENLLEIQFDMDEKHQYRDPQTHEYRMSQHHGHARLFPEVDGKLNGKNFASRQAIMTLNKALDGMSREKYGVPMLEGKKTKGGKTVEELKTASRVAELEEELRTTEAAIRDARRELGELERGIEDVGEYHAWKAVKDDQAAREAAKREQEEQEARTRQEAARRAQEAREAARREQEAQTARKAQEAAREAQAAKTPEELYQEARQRGGLGASPLDIVKRKTAETDAKEKELEEASLDDVFDALGFHPVE